MITFLVPKSKGAGIMISDFISENEGFLSLLMMSLRKHKPSILVLKDTQENQSNTLKTRTVTGHLRNSWIKYKDVLNWLSSSILPVMATK